MIRRFGGKGEGMNRDALKIGGLCVLLAGATQVFMACNATSSGTPNFAAGVDGTGGSSGTSGTTASSGTTTVAGVDPTQFSISVVPITNVKSVIHESDVSEFAYTSPCSISTSTIAATTAGSGSEPLISCIVEEAELDLYMHGIGLTFNVPPGVCNYLSFMPPYYYTYPVGNGPGAASYTVPAGGTPVNVSNTFDGSAYCPYDFTSSTDAIGDGPGPNCCLGTYSLTVTAGTGAPTTTSDIPWGGKASNCLGGPAMTTQPIDTATGFPRSLVYENVLAGGMVQTYNVSSPSSNDDASNIYVANYFKNSSVPADWPAAFRPVNGALPPTSGTYGNYQNYDLQTEPFYRFECLDSAHEVRARILVQVRSWDLAANVGVAASYSDTPGTDPVSGIPYHSFPVWDDITPWSGGLAPFGSGFSTTWEAGYPQYFH